METSNIIEKFEQYKLAKQTSDFAHQEFFGNLMIYFRDLMLQLEWEPDPYNKLFGLIFSKPNLDKDLFSKIKINNHELSKHYLYLSEIFPDINIKQPDPTLIRFRPEYIEIINYNIKLNPINFKIKIPESAQASVPPKISLPVIQNSSESK